MKTVIFSAGGAVALCLLLSSFVSSGDNYTGRADGYSIPSVQSVTDTVPRQASGMKKGAKGNMSGQGSGAVGEGNQSSDTRGEGMHKGRKGMKNSSADSTNQGATNTTDTTRA